MKFKFFRCLILFCFFSLFSVNVSAVDSEYFDEQIQASGANDLWQSLDSEDVELLEKLGIEETDFDSVFNVSFRNIADLFYEITRGEYHSVFDSLPLLLAIILVLSAVNQFAPDDSRVAEILEFVSLVISALLIITSLSECVTNAASAIYSSSNFITALIPVLAAVITVSGNPMLAVTYNSMCFAGAQFISESVDSFIRQVVQIILALSIVSSVCKAVNITKIIDFIKKTVIFVFGFMATVFVTMLSIKGMLAASADNVAIRGIRFLIGNMIPIVGGAVSDAYLSIVGSLNLVKNTVGAFSVAAVAVINLPVLVECILWIFSLNFLAAVGDVFSQESLSQLFRSVSSAMVLLTVSVLFVMLVFLLSVGIIYLIKGSA